VVKVLKAKEFGELLEAVRKRDAELRALIAGSVKDLIPPPVDALELRGPSWTKTAELAVSGVPTPPAPPRAGPPTVITLRIRVDDVQGAVVQGAVVHVVRPDTGADLGTRTTAVNGVAGFNVGGDAMYRATATKGELAGSVDVDVGRVDLGVRVVLAPATTPEAAPPAFAVGEAVIVYGSLTGAVAATPDAPGGLYEVLLASGARVMVSEDQLRRPIGLQPPVPRPTPV